MALLPLPCRAIRQTSDALRLGKVVLRLGAGMPTTAVATCEGETVKPDYDSRALGHIASREPFVRRSERVATAGGAGRRAALLQVANEDSAPGSRAERTF
ncbi:DUF1481 domain-containing protein [Shigella flexneri]